ncbi:serine/threonine protein kinase [Kitasatospora sp. NPDC058046]|uniref:serine/threonine protein kinase n=1 Tax=Kitasatospora sp. NPDC058046 TaxID=3346312 RepID=UPI0036D96E59
MRGTVLADRYRLVDWLGGGSMGDVWLAEDEVLGRRVAVKVVKPALLDEPGFAERFHAEARVMARLRHPGIVGVYDYGHSGGDGAGGDAHGDGHGGAYGRRPVGYLVMELIDGQPLSAVLERRGALPVAEALRLALQVLEALEAAHASGVVHQDIKPANLMVNGDRTVIADFGIAGPACDPRFTVPGVVLGTAAYQAPEQASTGTVTASADLYALGVVLYECLAGRLPYDGETALELILKHLTEPVPSLPGDVPAPVRAVVERAMAKDPGERWPDAATMAAALRQALAAGEAAPPSGPERPVARPAARQAPRARRIPRPGRRLRALAGVTALTLLCVAGAAGATVVRPGRDATPPGAAVAGPAAGSAVAGAAALVEAGRPPAGQPSAPAQAPVPSGGPGTGESPAPAAGPGPATAPPYATSAAPPPAPVPAAPAAPAPAPAAGQSPAAPAPTSAAPDRPAPGETATPTTPATPTQSAQPTPQPKPQLPAEARITGTNGALDNYSSNDQDGNTVGTYFANGTAAQLWRLDRVADGMYYLRNASSNFTKVLDQDRRSGLVQIWTSPPADWNQVWAIAQVPGGYRIANVATQLCLTSEGIGVGTHVAACTGAQNQVWTFN